MILFARYVLAIVLALLLVPLHAVPRWHRRLRRFVWAVLGDRPLAPRPPQIVYERRSESRNQRKRRRRARA